MSDFIPFIALFLPIAGLVLLTEKKIIMYLQETKISPNLWVWIFIVLAFIFLFLPLFILQPICNDFSINSIKDIIFLITSETALYLILLARRIRRHSCRR